MAELKPGQHAEGISLSRWSRLKRAAAEKDSATAVLAEPVEALVASDKSLREVAPNGKSDVAANADYSELPPISAISLTEDFTPFMQAKVPQALKQQALKALFKEPHFNVMDGLDIYIDDYTIFEPISPEVMATLSSWKTIMNPPKQVVTHGGYAVDVESEEGKAVLAARAQLAKAENALPDIAPVQVPSPAARERAEGEGEGGESVEPTSQTINPALTDESRQADELALATALTPTLSRAAGEGARQHIRYGKRVGDFSASSYAATEQPLLDLAADTDHAEAASAAPAAPKSITQ